MLESIASMMLFGLFLASVYSLQTISFNLVVGMLRILNLAHAELIVFGTYIAYWSWVLFNLDPFVSLPLSAILGLAAGFALYHLLIKKLVFSTDAALIATFALSLVLSEFMKVLWTANYRGISWTLGSIRVSSITVPVTYICSTLGSIVTILLIYFIMYKTYFGKACRAVAIDPTASAICGVNVKKTLLYGFVFSSCLAFISGNLLVVYAPTGINPYMGNTIIARCLVIATLGGLGNPWGALIGGLIIGMIEQIMPIVLMTIVPGIEPFSFTPFIYFMAYLLILLVKPEGILGGRR